MKNKLEEQASLKAELSYSYWAANAASEAPAPQPKKLSGEEAAAAAAALTHTASGASAWNAAGTFEERTLPLGWVREQLGELLLELRHSHGGWAVAVAELTSCTGEAHQWLSRGRKRAGFELCLEMRWRAQLAGGAAVEGTAKVPHAAADELDELALEVGCGPAGGGEAGGDGAPQPSEAQRRAAGEAVRAMAPALRAALERLLERALLK